jgi:hypothetical protein
MNQTSRIQEIKKLLQGSFKVLACVLLHVL